jgi:hypothetical protein
MMWNKINIVKYLICFIEVPKYATKLNVLATFSHKITFLDPVEIKLCTPSPSRCTQFRNLFEVQCDRAKRVMISFSLIRLARQFSYSLQNTERDNYSVYNI